MTALDFIRRSETIRWGTLAALLGACVLFGGASRNDVASLLVLQPFAVICGAIFLITPGPINWNSVRAPLLFLGAWAALVAVQLVPLSPGIWTALPGHSPFAKTADLADIEQPWRGISLTPDLTLASLVGLITPLVVLIGFASVPPARTRGLLPLFIGAAVMSALLGLAQIAGGEGSPFYFYDVTNTDSPVGFFSNRNHQAVLLAMAWPMLAIWATQPVDPRFATVRRAIALSVAVFLLPMMLTIGSRAGLLLGGLGIATAFLFWRRRDASSAPRDRWSSLIVPTAFGAALCVMGAAVVLSRDEAVQRFTGVAFTEESRLQYLPTLLRIAGDFFPVGAGFGSFDPVYRFYEPIELLDPRYLNHAHNDLVEIAIEGGLPALALLALLLLWLCRRAVTVIRSSEGGRSVAFARLGLIMIVMLLLSSVVDYPIRTPLMAALFAVACAWLSAYERRAPRASAAP